MLSFSVLRLDEASARAYVKADLCLLSALWTPKGDEWGLRLVTDWNHWVGFTLTIMPMPNC